MTDDLLAISVPPETHPALRRGELLVLLERFTEAIAVDWVGYIEFFAANPFLIWREASRERTQLKLAGFSPVALSYQATTERYANRRSRLRSDLAALVAWGYVRASSVEGRLACELSPAGREAAGALSSLYADAFRLSVSLVLPRMRRASDLELSRRVQQWLHLGDMRIDLLDIDFAVDVEGQTRLL